VIGIGGTAGAVGGMIFSLYVGQVLERIGTYSLIFYVAGSVYLIALAIMHWLVPRLDQAEVC
jgi:ACS family hexuronate transporter-like MFS transporter